jgi:hypothetical protein
LPAATSDAALNHPHIGAIYGLDEANGTQFFVLELIDGETLAERIAKGGYGGAGHREAILRHVLHWYAGGLEGRGRILISESELSLKVRDALGLFGKLPLTLGQLAAQALILLLQALLGVLAPSSLRPRRASHGTPVRSICTGP